MDQGLGFLFAAFAVTWAGLFGYVFFVQRTLGETRRRLRWLEEDEPRLRRTGDGPGEAPRT